MLLLKRNYCDIEITEKVRHKKEMFSSGSYIEKIKIPQKKVWKFLELFGQKKKTID